MYLSQLIDPWPAAIVLGGTLAATTLRCGWHQASAAIRAVGQLSGRPFDSGRIRAELAAQIREIDEDGLLRAQPHRFGDREFDELSDALVRHRSIKILHEEHDKHRTRRMALSHTAAGVLSQAAELAPVLGLAGTLLSLGGLSTAAAANGDFARAIGTAVTTTLYGVIAANFLFAPLAAAVTRRAQAEEQARRDLLDWLAAGIERSGPHGGGTALSTKKAAA